MAPVRLLLLVVGATAVLAGAGGSRWSDSLTGGAVAGRGGGTAICRTAADTAARVERIILSAVATIESAELSSYGFITQPSSITLVTSETTCDSVVAGYNAHMMTVDSSRRISAAYVFTGGGAYLLPEIREGDSRYHAISVLDSTYTVRRGFELQD